MSDQDALDLLREKLGTEENIPGADDEKSENELDFILNLCLSLFAGFGILLTLVVLYWQRAKKRQQVLGIEGKMLLSTEQREPIMRFG